MLIGVPLDLHWVRLSFFPRRKRIGAEVTLVWSPFTTNLVKAQRGASDD